MVIAPNITAVEYQEVKEEINEKSNDILSIFSSKAKINNNLLKIIPINFIIILSVILQSILFIGLAEVIITVLASIENDLLAFLLPTISGFIFGWFLSAWNSKISDIFDLTNLQDLILEGTPYLIYFLYFFFTTGAERDSNFV